MARNLVGRWRNLPLAAGVLALTMLTGCAAAQIEPTPTTTASQVSTPAPTRTANPTVMPENRFGIPCDELLAPDELTRPFGMPLELRLPTGFGRVDVAALIQDGALYCRWGDGPFLDDSGTAFTVTAAPRGERSFDEIVAFALGNDGSYSLVEVVGPWDRGLVQCLPPDVSLSGAGCKWTVQVGELWVVLEFDRLVADQVDAILLGEPLASATSREDSAASALVARVVQHIANANIGEVLAFENQIPPCATLADWDLIGSQLGLPLTSVESRFGSKSVGVSGQALDEMVVIASDHQSARSCVLEFGDFNDAVRPTYIRVGVVPGGAWVPGTNLWLGSGAERCGPFEGGPICELSSAVGSTGVYVVASGTLYEGVPTIVLAEIVSALG